MDSYFWQRLTWPEGVVLFYNTALNKSSEWGVSPWHWYFATALPKALNFSLPFVLLPVLGLRAPVRPVPGSHCVTNAQWVHQLCISCVGTPDLKLIYYVSPALLFIILYSFLPHKELRFILPVIPLLTLAAARGIDRLLPVYEKKIDPMQESSNTLTPTFAYGITTVIRIGLLFAGLGMLAVTALLLFAAMANYPGGVALNTLHRHLFTADGLMNESHLSHCHRVSPVLVHIDPDAAMTGVTRFGECCHVSQQLSGRCPIVYSKEEQISSAANLLGFHYLLTSNITAMDKDRNFEILSTVDTFDRYSRVSLAVPVPLTGGKVTVRIPWLRRQLKPSIYVLRRKNCPL